MQTQEDHVADCLAALGNATRLALYRLLVRAGPEGLRVGEIQQHLGIPASTLTHHIAKLAKPGLITQQRNGREIICTADYERMNFLTSFLSRECCLGVPESSAPAA